MGNVRVVLCALALIAVAASSVHAETSEECQQKGSYKIKGASLRESCGAPKDRTDYTTDIGNLSVEYGRIEVTTDGDPLPAFWKSEIEPRHARYDKPDPIVKRGGLWTQKYSGNVDRHYAVAGVQRGTATTPPVIVYWVLSMGDLWKSTKLFSVTIPSKQLLSAAELKNLKKPTTMLASAPPPAAPPVDDDPDPIIKARLNFSSETPAFSDSNLPTQIKQDSFQLALPADAKSIGTNEWTGTARGRVVQIKVQASTGTLDIPKNKRAAFLNASLVPSAADQAKLQKYLAQNGELRGRIWFHQYKYEVPSPTGGAPAEVWMLRLGGFRDNRPHVWSVMCAMPYGATDCVSILTSFRITDTESYYEKTPKAAAPSSTPSTVSMTTPGQASTTAAALDICPSLNALVAAAPGKFASIRGATPDSRGGLDMYSSSVSMPGAVKSCGVTQGAGLWFASCTMGDKLPEATAKALLSALRDQIKTCGPSWTATTDGDTTTFKVGTTGTSILLRTGRDFVRYHVSITVSP